MILSAQSIRLRCPDPDGASLVTPFHERTVQNGKSFGLSAAGYDVRVEFDGDGLMGRQMMTVLPGDSILASTMERFNMPNDLIAVVHDKSSWARQGLAVQNTVIEPGWAGYLTLEISNHSKVPIAIWCGDPIAQILFHLLDRATNLPYKGKYQDQGRGPQQAIQEQP